MAKVDQEDIRKRAAELAEALAHQAGASYDKASEAAREGVEQALPKIMGAVENAVKAASPYVERGADEAAKLTLRAGEALESFSDEHLPCLTKAVSDAARRAEEEARSVKPELIELAAVEAVRPRKKRHPVRTTLKWGAVAGVVAGVGYLVWRRSQPVEDPWAEEYWADLETQVVVPDAPAEAAEDAAEAVQDVAADAADKVADVADAAADTAVDTADEVADKVDTAADAVAEKVEEAAE